MKKSIKIVLCVFLFMLIGYLLVPSQKLFHASVAAERKLADLTPKLITIDEGDIAYIEGGKGDVVIFLHGFGANKDNWVRLAKYLKNDYTIIAIDLPGFGQSFKAPNVRYDVESQINRVHQLVNKLGIEKFHIAGNSMGGYIAGNYAVSYPEKVISLWLLNTLGVESADNSEMFNDIAHNKRPMVLASNQLEFEQLIDFVFENPPFMPEFVISELSKNASKNYDLYRKIFYQIHHIENEKVRFSLPLDKTLATFSKPVLITWGKKDRVLHYSGANVLTKVTPHAKSVIMDNMGHLPMLEAPKETAEQFIAFNKNMR